MTARIDFSLSRRFSIVERIIFRLVLGGVREVRTITALLSLFSDSVVANAIKKLVNFQILNADLEAQTLSISESLTAIMEQCLEQSEALELPAGETLMKEDGEIYITDEDTKRKILRALLPDVNVGFLAGALDFVVCDRGESDEQCGKCGWWQSGKCDEGAQAVSDAGGCGGIPGWRRRYADPGCVGEVGRGVSFHENLRRDQDDY